MSVQIFYSYSHRDERYKDSLETHLKILKRQGAIDDWNDRKIAPGSDWKEEINLNLQNAKIVLLLVSSNFLASDYCYDSETIYALEQHKKKKAIVIPIIIKPSLWKESNFKHLQALPKDAKPISQWRDKDAAWLIVVEGLLTVIKQLPELIYEDYGKITYGDKHSVEVSMRETETLMLEDLLGKFLSLYNRWYISPLRIQKWGSKQNGFESLANYSIRSIRTALKRLYSEGKLKTTISQKGNTLYRTKN